jgi:hypothetical protein
MPNEDTSSTESAMPNVDQPVKGTPATVSETPQKPSLSLEEALKRLEDLERSNKNAIEERDRHRKKLSTYEEAERKAQEAQLSEIEKVNKQYKELQTQHDTYARQMQERVVRYEIEAQARNIGVIDPEAAALLLDRTELEFAEDGTPTNLAKLLEALVKKRPYLLAKTVEPPAVIKANVTPTLPAMNPGRSQIQQPGTLPAGQRPSLQDAYRLARERQ